MSETRVALVKPGDVLLIGNVGDIPVEDLNDLHDALDSLKRALGIERVFVFEADIDLGLTASTPDPARAVCRDETTTTAEEAK